nr:MAG TPA: hypothetical protein [Caudoviricetes sp.]
MSFGKFALTLVGAFFIPLPKTNIIAEEKRTQLCIGIMKFVVNLNKFPT